MFDLYIFDFDGTLADTSNCIIASFEATFKKFGRKKPSRKIIKYNTGLPLFKVLEKLGIEEEERDKYILYYRKQYSKLLNSKTRLYPGIKKILKALKKKDKVIYVATSKGIKGVSKNLKVLGINKYFDFVIGEETVKNKKPHPETVFFSLKNSQIKSQRAIMIGDSSFDIQMGKAGGIKACAVTWGAHNRKTLLEAKPDFIVSKPSMLSKII